MPDDPSHRRNLIEQPEVRRIPDGQEGDVNNGAAALLRSVTLADLN
jgi:hypothetical protein